MDAPGDIAMVVVIVSAATVVAAATIRQAAARARQRAHALRVAADALDAHLRALVAVLDEPALSDEIKDSLARYSDATSDPDFARLIARQLGRPPHGTVERPTFPFADELDALRRHRPDVLDDIRTLVTSGAVSSILRWPETAAAFESLAADLAVDQRRGMNLLGRVLQGGFDGPERLGTAGA